MMHPHVSVILNDTNAALTSLWTQIIDEPQLIAEQYAVLWRAQQDNPRAFYDTIRSEFNATQRPELFLYLLARCVKAAIRYNSSGEFNQSPDNRRLGSRPARMAQQIQLVSSILRGRTELRNDDFRNALHDASPSDVIYMDPPYQGVSTNRDRRYAEVLGYDEFADALASFNRRNLSFVISYDGRTGAKKHGKPLPPSLRLTHFEIDAGRSTQDTLAGGKARTVESLYLSPALVERLGGPPDDPRLVRAGSSEPTRILALF